MGLALIQVCSFLAVASAAPQFAAISEVVNSRTGEVIPVDVNNQDIAGCLVGPSGERVCPLVAVGSDGRSQVSARGNRGPGPTGSNGNAGKEFLSLYQKSEWEYVHHINHLDYSIQQF